MTAPRGYSGKTGKGRAVVARRVPDVESLQCPRGGTHKLRNSPARGGLVTACAGCGKSWSEIDARLRGAS